MSFDSAHFFAMARDLDKLRRTVVCHPDREPEVSTAIAGFPLVTVKPSVYCPPGKMFVIDESKLDEILDGFEVTP